MPVVPRVFWLVVGRLWPGSHAKLPQVPRRAGQEDLSTSRSTLQFRDHEPKHQSQTPLSAPARSRTLVARKKGTAPRAARRVAPGRGGACASRRAARRSATAALLWGPQPLRCVPLADLMMQAERERPQTGPRARSSLGCRRRRCILASQVLLPTAHSNVVGVVGKGCGGLEKDLGDVA